MHASSFPVIVIGIHYGNFVLAFTYVIVLVSFFFLYFFVIFFLLAMNNTSDASKTSKSAAYGTIRLCWTYTFANIWIPRTLSDLWRSFEMVMRKRFNMPATDSIAIQRSVHGHVVGIVGADAELLGRIATFVTATCCSYTVKKNAVILPG